MYTSQQLFASATHTGMMPYLIARIDALMRVARDTYGVDPVIFLAIYLSCAPFWYFSMFRSLRAISIKRVNDVMLWGTVFLATTVAPFIYVMLFGRNLPWWVYVIIAALVVQGGSTLIRRMRRPLGG
jgi:hypothetical protein